MKRESTPLPDREFIYAVWVKVNEPQVYKAKVVRVTPQYVFIDLNSVENGCSGAFRYASRHNRDEVCWTERDAIEKYSDKKEREIEHTETRLLTLRQHYAKARALLLPFKLKEVESARG